MKCISIFLLVLVFFSVNLSAQQCYPVSKKVYKDVYKAIKKSKDDSERMEEANEHLFGNCFESAQMDELLALFDSDNYRSKFLLKHFNKITDPQHIYQALNSFEDMAMVLSTYEQLRPSILEDVNGVGVQKEPVNAMDDSQFAEKFSFVEAEPYSRDKKERIQYFFESASLSLGQIEMIVKQFPYTRDKKWALKLLYENCAEKDKYYRFASIFPFESDREDLLAFIN